MQTDTFYLFLIVINGVCLFVFKYVFMCMGVCRVRGQPGLYIETCLREQNNPFSEFFSRIILIMYLTAHFNEAIVLYFLLDLSFKGSVLHIYFELKLSE